MNIVSVVDRKLTDGEIKSMRQFRSYTDGVSFACLRERVMVMLHNESHKDAELLKAKVPERMDAALSQNPDFTVWNMDDGHVLLCLPAGIFAVSPEPVEGSMDIYLSLRSECLDACDKGEVIAVAYEEE